jgi:glycosyltransferase involved in cell wall biosynthesis
VIIPTYNSAAFLPQAVASALEQSYARTEVIIIDDASTDNTGELLERYAQNSKITVLRTDKCSGPATARNYGLSKASGDLIAFIDADDVWMPEKLSKQVKELEDNPDLGWNYCDGLVVDAVLNPQYLISDRNNLPEGMIYEELMLRHPLIIPSGVLIRKEVFDYSGLFDPEIRGVEDWDLFLRIASKYKCSCLRQPLFQYRIHGDNISRRAAKMETALGLAYAKLITRHPDLTGVLSGNYHRNVGASWLQEGDRGKARAHYAKAIRHRPADWQSWTGLLISSLPAGGMRVLVKFKKRFIKRSLS